MATTGNIMGRGKEWDPRPLHSSHPQRKSLERGSNQRGLFEKYTLVLYLGFVKRLLSRLTKMSTGYL